MEDDFATLKDYNDYLERVETISKFHVCFLNSISLLLWSFMARQFYNLYLNLFISEYNSVNQWIQTSFFYSQYLT